MTTQRKTWMTAAVLAAVVVPFGATSLLDAEDPPIVRHMEAMNTPYKAIRRQARRKAFDAETIKNVNIMQEHALQAMHVAIPVIEKLSADKRQAMVAEYKKIQGDTVIALIHLEVALEKGDKEAAAKMIDELGSLKKAGHDKFVPEDGS